MAHRLLRTIGRMLAIDPIGSEENTSTQADDFVANSTDDDESADPNFVPDCGQTPDDYAYDSSDDDDTPTSERRLTPEPAVSQHDLTDSEVHYEVQHVLRNYKKLPSWKRVVENGSEVCMERVVQIITEAVIADRRRPREELLTRATRSVLVHAECQVGKTCIPAIAGACHTVDTQSCAVVSWTCNERDDMVVKLNEDHYGYNRSYKAVAQQGQQSQRLDDLSRNCVVAPRTVSAIRKLLMDMAQLQTEEGGVHGWVLVLNECDEHHSSQEVASPRYEYEKALDALMGYRSFEGIRIYGPSVAIYVSATQLPTLIWMDARGVSVRGEDIIVLPPHPNYVSVEECMCLNEDMQLVRLEDATDDCFLDDGELTNGKDWESEKTWRILDHARSIPGGLVNFIANTRVNAGCTVQKQGDRIMARMPEYSVVCYVGGQNVFYRSSEQEKWTQLKLSSRWDVRARTPRRRGNDGAPIEDDADEHDLTDTQYHQLMDVIESMQDRLPDRPIAVLGFTALNRGVTIFGSTHEITSRGVTQPMEKDVHAQGRRAGNNREVLHAKGLLSGPVVLGHKQDLLGCIAYYRLMKHILALIQSGKCNSFREALQQPVPKDCDISVYREGRKETARLVGNAKHQLHLNVQDEEDDRPGRTRHTRDRVLQRLSKHQHALVMAFGYISLDRPDLGRGGVSLQDLKHYSLEAYTANQKQRNMVVQYAINWGLMVNVSHGTYCLTPEGFDYFEWHRTANAADPAEPTTPRRDPPFTLQYRT